MHQVVPTLRITNYARSKAFYVDALGFQIDWEHRFKPDFPVLMQVSRDGMALFITEHAGDCPVGRGAFLGQCLESLDEPGLGEGLAFAQSAAVARVESGATA